MVMMMRMMLNDLSRMVNRRPVDHHQTFEIFNSCVCVCTESGGADVAGTEALQRHDEPGTPAGIRGTPVYLPLCLPACLWSEQV